MNTIQPSSSAQNIPPSDSSQAGKIPSTEEFVRQLMIAQNDSQWFTKSEAQAEKERIVREEAKERKANEILEQDKSTEIILAALTEAQQKSPEQLDKLQEINGMKIKDSQMAAKQEVFDNAVQEKVSAQKSHLITPAVAEDGVDEQLNRFSDLLQKGLDESLQKSGSDGKPNGFSLETAKANPAKSETTTPINGLHQKNDLTGGFQNSLNQPDFQSNRQSVRNLAEGQSSNMDQRNRSDSSLSGRTSLKGLTARSRSNLSASVELNKTDPASSTKSSEAKERAKVDIQEVVGKVKLMISSKKNEMVMRLAPEHLGRLEIKLKKEGDKLIGRFKVKSAEAKRALETQLPELRKGLQDQGIHLEEFSILVAEHHYSESTFSSNDGQSWRQDTQESPSRNSVAVNGEVAGAEQIVRPETSSNAGVSVYI